MHRRFTCAANDLKAKHLQRGPDNGKGVISFARDILPLFRPIDIKHMAPMGVLLDDYA